MNNFTYPGYNDDELKEEIERCDSLLCTLRDQSKETRAQLHQLKIELKDRQAHEPIDVPRWVLEVLSAHARKRYQNITPGHRTTRYRKALDYVQILVGEMWPRDIDGEHHGCDPTGGRR